MTVTLVGDVTLGAALPAAASATAAVNVLVSASLPEVTSKLSGYGLLAIPSPSFDIGAQLGQAGTNLTADLALVAALPGVGAAWAAAIAAGIAATASLRAANPALGAKIDGSISAIGGLNAQISAGVSGPNINVTLIAAIIAELEALKASIETQASLSASIGANLGVGGLRVYRFDGERSGAGAELQAQFNVDGITGDGSFVALVPTSQDSLVALEATVKTV